MDKKQKEFIEGNLLNDYKQSQLFNLFHDYHQKQDEEHYIVTAQPANNIKQKSDSTSKIAKDEFTKSEKKKENFIDANSDYKTFLNTRLNQQKALNDPKDYKKEETNHNTEINHFENTTAKTLSENSPQNQAPRVFGNENIDFQEQNNSLASITNHVSTERSVQNMRNNTENAHIGPNVIQNQPKRRNIKRADLTSTTENKKLDSIDESLPFNQRVITPATSSKGNVSSDEDELYTKVKESVTTAEWLKKANSFAIETSKEIKNLKIKRIKLLSLEDESKSSILLDDLLLHYLASIIVGKNLDIFLIFRDTTIISIAPNKWLESNNISKTYLLNNGYKYSYENLDVNLLIESLKPFCAAASVTNQTTQLWLKFVPILSR